jgi:hypothetical protein
MEPQEPDVREVFRVCKKVFIVPQELGQLDPQTKRKTTICNLFINHQLAISDIARVLDEHHSRVIDVLIERGIIQERRSVSRTVKEPPSRPGLGSRFKTRSTA